MAGERFSEQIVRELRLKFPQDHIDYIPHERHDDEDVVVVPHLQIENIARELKPHFPSLMDVCGVDYPEREKRFEVVYHFADPAKKRRLRVKSLVKEGEKVPTVTPVFKSANWFEREAFDMFGIPFSGHPYLRRILCHEDFVGHALRKDYPADRNQSLKTPLEHTFAKDRERMMSQEVDHLSDKVWLNIGPAHPATHGTLRFMAVLEGETIRSLDVEIGYLHRCFEKMAETHTYNGVIPYTDRLNYCSSPLNNNAWCRSIEKLCGINVPDRAKVIRIILDEFSRVIDHFVCIITQLVDVGALTNFWIGMRAREAVYDLFEKLCGARLTVSLARVGGLGFDLPEGWVELAEKVCDIILETHREVDVLATKNRIYVNRMVDITPISAEEAINWGFTGPCLRACGVPRDLRKDHAYGGYDQFDFDIPIGEKGDCYDRYLVRMEEIRQSVRIIRQALKQIPAGPIIVSDTNIVLPSKSNVYGNIEGLMHQFMKVIYDVEPPVGEIYDCSEGANGELGFYVVSDGTGHPYRVKCRPPCFAIFQGFPKLLEGHMIADAIAALGTINIIAGELDR
ncbi:MAG: NADH dehydrogenase (quinone) subunit D [Deltaproteobacteria bacterium]|nr:NADH dehydrogenase (quinone) subunit D [Deltaproteobacteria bacterium]